MITENKESLFLNLRFLEDLLIKACNDYNHIVTNPNPYTVQIVKTFTIKPDEREKAYSEHIEYLSERFKEGTELWEKASKIVEEKRKELDIKAKTTKKKIKKPVKKVVKKVCKKPKNAGRGKRHDK